jgi:hypothetical protein
MGRTVETTILFAHSTGANVGLMAVPRDTRIYITSSHNRQLA